ncbi:MAG: ShlB/FhaC/HecB family hemolysin secretion/activation protein [Gammaproteobacteria bacterium]|nr:ShlB/FhaC/HecB family hemolysin secretion/activation protein [Gammaproteobacteria bacterium]
MALRCLHALCVAGVVARAGLVSAAPGALNDSAADGRPGAVRPSFDAPAVAAPAALEQTQNLAASEPAPATLAAAMAPNENSLAATVDLPDAAKPGAMRPGDKPREAPQAPPPESSFKVPALVDRPLEIDDGEKLAVKQFVLDGAIDRPQHGIAVADLQALVDAKLAERPDGFTVGRLQEVADAVTKYYRDRGLILAQAFVPVQSVDGGAVKIQIMEGLLGNVVTEGNKMYKPKVLSQPFTKLIGQPVTKESIESALLTVSDNPGLSSFGVFQPGTRVGTADIMLKVQDEKRFESALRWDNHGIRETGLNRELGRFTVNDPLGVGDRFTTTIQRTVAPRNTWFYALDYQIPVVRLYDTMFGIGVDRNQFDVGGDFRDANIHSDIRNYNISLTKNFVRSRLMNFSATTRLAKKRSGTKSDGRKQNIDSLVVASGEFNFDNVDARFGGLNTASLEISHGFNDLFGAMGSNPAFVPPTRQGGNGKFAEGDFNKVMLRLSRFQALTPLWDKLKNHNLLFTTELMWSPDLLVPLEQYDVGGPDNVRGYRPTEKLFDRAVFGSVEWIINAPFVSDVPAFGNRTWGELVQVSFFYDVASGYLNSALTPTERKAENFNSVGMAFSFNNPKAFSSKLTIAAPVGGSPRPEDTGWGPKYWLDFNLFF